MCRFSKHSVLFVCFGNICRSPIAESVFRKLLEERYIHKKWEVDSAATGSWFTGREPDPRTVSVLRSMNYNCNRKVRQVEDQDFCYYEYMLAMDDEVLSDLKRMEPKDSTAKLELLGDYDPAGDSYIDDPYFTRGDKAFYKVLDQCKRSCDGFLRKVLSDDGN